MKLAAAQTWVSADIAANGQAIRDAIAEAAAQGARLVLFCEGALSGYAKAQIADPGHWAHFDWAAQERELRAIAALCAERGIFAVVGGAHRLLEAARPHNSLYVLSDKGLLLTRYDKRYLSHSELTDWYSPGREPVLFEVDGYRFGCALCIEVQFAEVFLRYGQAGADAVLFASYGMPESFQIALKAHASLNLLWIAGATPAQKGHKGPAGFVGPDGRVITHAVAAHEADLAFASIDRTDPLYAEALYKARPWRALAREGSIYRERQVDDIRSRNRSDY